MIPMDYVLIGWVNSVKYTNVSDGESDGFVLFYVKNKKLHSVLLNEIQASLLDLSLKMVFDDEPAKVIPTDSYPKRLGE